MKKIFKCENCKGVINDSQKYCNHCGSQLMDADKVINTSQVIEFLKTGYLLFIGVKGDLWVKAELYNDEKDDTIAVPVNLLVKLQKEGKLVEWKITTSSDKVELRRMGNADYIVTYKLSKNTYNDSVKLRRKKLSDEDFLGEGDPDISYDPTDVYAELTEEYEEAETFFGSESDFLSMVEDVVREEELSIAEAVDALLQMFFYFLDDPEGFLAELELGDSVARNKKARYVIDQLTKAGLSHAKAVALLAYHGGLKNIKSMKDAKGLLRYKYLRDMLSEAEAQKVVDYFSGKKACMKIAGVNDSKKENVRKRIYKCENCENEVTDSQKYCNHCGSQLMDAKKENYYKPSPGMVAMANSAKRQFLKKYPDVEVKINTSKGFIYVNGVIAQDISSMIGNQPTIDTILAKMEKVYIESKK